MISTLLNPKSNIY